MSNTIKNPKVYIIILNYNNWWDTIECLESVLRNEYTNYQVIVVDNNSPNESMQYIKAWAEGKLDVWINTKNPLRNLAFPPVPKPIPYVFYTREEAEKGGNPKLEKLLESKIPKGITTKYPLILIQSGFNGGFAFGNNIAIKYILGKTGKKKNSEDLILLLNPDIVIERHTLFNLVRCYINFSLKNGNLIVCGGVLHSYYNPSSILTYGGGKLNIFLGKIKNLQDLSQEPDFISGGFFLTNIRNFIYIGLLSEKYFLYWEETDWCFKLKKKGGKLFICEKALAYDKISSTAKKGSFIVEYHNFKSCLIFYKTYFPYLLPIVMFTIPFRFLKKLINGNLKAPFYITKALIDSLLGR